VATKPSRIELLEDGVVKLILTNSDEGSLNNRRDPQTGRVYNGRATSAVIFGPKGAGVRFYDDQKFRTGENSVYIEKLTDERIEVRIAGNFVKETKKHSDGMFFGEEPGKYTWVLCKAVKRNWLQKWLTKLEVPVPLTWADIVNKARAVTDKIPILSDAGAVIGFVLTEATPVSDNYRVDNCSSVQFGGAVLTAS
jgi:hypothetical protein